MIAHELADFLEAHKLPGKDSVKLEADIHEGTLLLTFLPRGESGNYIVDDDGEIREYTLIESLTIEG